MAPKQPPLVLPPNLTVEKLVPVQQLLHLTVHRNKNQHRITKWWGNLQLLRRNINRLVEMLQSQSAEFRKTKDAMLKMCQWMEIEIIPRTYLSFSAVVADNQYASLGLMLMGCLARVNACVSFPRSRALSEEEGRQVGTSSRTVIPSEDFGEAITREEDGIVEEVLEEAGKGSRMREKQRKDIFDGERGERVPRDVEETDPKLKNSMKREVLDVEGSSEEEQRQPPKKLKKIKKVSRKFVEEFEHLSGMSSSEEEPPLKKSKRAAPPAQRDTSHNDEEAKPLAKKAKMQPYLSNSDDEIKPVLKKSKKVASIKTSKPLKKKKKKGGDDFDDLFASLM